MADVSSEWQTYHDKSKEKKKRWRERKAREEGESHGTAETMQSRVADPSAGAFADFDRAFAVKAVTDNALMQDHKGDRAQKTFAGLVDEDTQTPPADETDTEDVGGSSADEQVHGKYFTAPAPASAPKQLKKPKIKRPKLSVAQVAADVDVELLQSWMAEAQLRYSSNETAQVQALSDWLLAAFKEAALDFGKLLATKGLQQASQQPLCDMPNTLMNALASFVASVSEGALAKVVVPLTVAVLNEAAAAATPVAPGKGKAGLLLALAVILRTRPQVLVPAAAELQAAAGKLSSESLMLSMLWVINQAALAEPAVGVAVWVRVLLPQLLGLPDLPTLQHQHADKQQANTTGRTTADLHKPLDPSLQSTAVDYINHLLQQLDVPEAAAAGKLRAAHGQYSITPHATGADVVWEADGVLPTVPGSAVEALSRALAGVSAAAAASGGVGPSAAAATGGGEDKKVAAARAAAAVLLAPLLPSLAGLATGTSCEQQYSEWLLLAFDSAGLSAAVPGSPDELVLRSATHVVACICISENCFQLWESKHKASLRGSARVLAALEQHPQLLQPLQAHPSVVQSLRQLLAALPARHRTFLATGKGGWQGACAKVAEDACQKLLRKLPLGGWRITGTACSSGGSAISQAAAVLGGTAALAGVVAVLGLYRHEVAGVVQAYAGKDAAQQLDANVLAPLAAGLQQLAPCVQSAQPYVQQVQKAVAPVVDAVKQAVIEPTWVRLQQLIAYVQHEMEEVDAVAGKEEVDITLT